MRKLLQRLARLGRVVEVAPDQFFLRPVVAEMIAIAHGLRPTTSPPPSSATSSTTAARSRS